MNFNLAFNIVVGVLFFIGFLLLLAAMKIGGYIDSIGKVVWKCIQLVRKWL
mgnify:CR=1 FL=1